MNESQKQFIKIWAAFRLKLDCPGKLTTIRIVHMNENRLQLKSMNKNELEEQHMNIINI